MTAKKIFEITPKLIVKFENNNTVIYVDEKRFMHCKYILLINPDEKQKHKTINSIDEAKKELSSKLEGRLRPRDLGITPEQEFWAHCSNLQVWVENNYDTHLLDSNLAFPLLKKLTEAEDKLAKRVFKEEITKRLLENYIQVKFFLIEEKYLDNFNREEIKYLLDYYKDYIKILNDNIVKKEELEIFVLISLKYLNPTKSGEFIDIYNHVVEIYKQLSNTEIIKTKIWYEIGKICKRHDKKDFAIKCFKKVIHENPKHIYAWGNLGIIYSDIGKAYKAIKAFKKGLKLDPKNTELLILLAEEYHEIDKVNKVIHTCRKTLKVNSEIAEVWSLLGETYKCFPEGENKDKGNIDKAIECHSRAFKIEPTNIFILNDLINLYFLKKDHNLTQKYGILNLIEIVCAALGCKDKVIDARFTKLWYYIKEQKRFEEVHQKLNLSQKPYKIKKKVWRINQLRAMEI